MINLLVNASTCGDSALAMVLKSVRNILTLVQIIAPILLMIMATVELVQLIRDPEDKKKLKKVQNSAIAAIVIFFIPTLINVVMNMLGNSFTISECWNSIGNPKYSNKYQPINPKQTLKPVIPNPDDYERGGSGYSGEIIEGTAQQIGDVVWDPNDVTRISNLTSTQLIGILNAFGGNARNFIPYASGLITAEQKYHVNVFFLIGVEALESGWVTSAISQNCNNLGGVCASSDHPSNGCGKNSNCSFAYFNSAYEFIDYHARMLHNNYLTEGGAYYHGKTPSGVVVSYCPGCTSWPSSVISIANSLFSHVKDVL